jgi:hypothetical protein
MVRSDEVLAGSREMSRSFLSFSLAVRVVAGSNPATTAH